jgi:hypothetical protein
MEVEPNSTGLFNGHRMEKWEATSQINFSKFGVGLSLTKELKIYDGEIAASSTKTAGKTG